MEIFRKTDDPIEAKVNRQFRIGLWVVLCLLIALVGYLTYRGAWPSVPGLFDVPFGQEDPYTPDQVEKLVILYAAANQYRGLIDLSFGNPLMAGDDIWYNDLQTTAALLSVTTDYLVLTGVRGLTACQTTVRLWLDGDSDEAYRAAGDCAADVREILDGER